MRILTLTCVALHLAAATHSQSGTVTRSPSVIQEKTTRQKQLPAIVAVLGRFTTPERAHRLAYLCYEATLDTPFRPIDLAEIALVETGGHRLSSDARSSEGALGVWQLMPARARSHGFTASQMRQDHHCAEAAVRELMVKLRDAAGDRLDAKRRYCGAGPQARAYERKTLRYRQMILEKMSA